MTISLVTAPVLLMALSMVADVELVKAAEMLRVTLV